ncbi:hypothetical protein EWM64_g7928 [Hericium alpestre]|uniref:Major facilitator superfamily (MFS) profile domain-containing protein n=1 Tax=Hericium alpestre TaxID=135208 RepID=A0A4Y9ZP93_9AGAM|nr:hypothetical protein EWM64_g7928 [Hericium alpestre]
MARRDAPSLTTFGWIVSTWVLVVSFQYGYHISTLNQIQAVLTCRYAGGEDDGRAQLGLPRCIPMSDATFSVVTSAFTVGGLVGSLVANIFMDRYGRKRAVQCSGLAVGVGAALMSVSGSVAPLLVGRAFTGVGAGIGLCVGPVFIAEIAPERLKSSLGVLTQFAIVMGILITQALGLYMATPGLWRLVFVFSSALSIAQLLLSPFMVDTPVWLTRGNQADVAKGVVRKLWTAVDKDLAVADGAEDPLLEEQDQPDDVSEHTVYERPSTVSVLGSFRARELRRPLSIVSLGMIMQQLSGINAVLYYSNDILSKALPGMGPYISLGITIVNVFMTFPPIILIKRVGHKALLRVSMLGACTSLILAGFGLNHGMVALTSVAVMAFVASFAVGIGPVPFVMIPEVSPSYAVSALSSIALSMNWIANFIVALVFLPLRNFLSHGDPAAEGQVFYVFAILLSLLSLGLFYVWRA